MRTDKEQALSPQRIKVKVVFLGQQSAGKTSILSRFIHDRFEDSLGATVGIDFMGKNILVQNNLLRMQLWDTAGQERFRALIPNYLKDAMIVFIVFDLTEIKSFQAIAQWVELSFANKKDKSTLILLGNKADLEHAITPSEIQKVQKLYKVHYFEVSAKTGQNIKEAFQYAGMEYVKACSNESVSQQNQPENSFAAKLTTPNSSIKLSASKNTTKPEKKRMCC